MKDELKTIYKHFGMNNQLKKLNEECFEFIEAVNAFTYAYDDEDLEKVYKHLVEEYADMLVLLNQFKIAFEINSAEVNNIINAKIKRTIDEIKHPEKRIERKGE